MKFEKGHAKVGPGRSKGTKNKSTIRIRDIFEKLKSLNVQKVAGHERPHKQCMLLAIISMIEQGKIVENKITSNSCYNCNNVINGVWG